MSKPSTKAPTGQLPCTEDGAYDTPCSATRHMVQADGTGTSNTSTPAGTASTRASATGGRSSWRRVVREAATVAWGPGMGPAPYRPSGLWPAPDRHETSPRSDDP